MDAESAWYYCNIPRCQRIFKYKPELIQHKVKKHPDKVTSREQEYLKRIFDQQAQNRHPRPIRPVVNVSNVSVPQTHIPATATTTTATNNATRVRDQDIQDIHFDDIESGSSYPPLPNHCPETPSNQEDDEVQITFTRNVATGATTCAHPIIDLSPPPDVHTCLNCHENFLSLELFTQHLDRCNIETFDNLVTEGSSAVLDFDLLLEGDSGIFENQNVEPSKIFASEIGQPVNINPHDHNMNMESNNLEEEEQQIRMSTESEDKPRKRKRKRSKPEKSSLYPPDDPVNGLKVPNIRIRRYDDNNYLISPLNPVNVPPLSQKVPHPETSGITKAIEEPLSSSVRVEKSQIPVSNNVDVPPVLENQTESTRSSPKRILRTRRKEDTPPPKITSPGPERILRARRDLHPPVLTRQTRDVTRSSSSSSSMHLPSSSSSTTSESSSYFTHRSALKSKSSTRNSRNRKSKSKVGSSGHNRQQETSFNPVKCDGPHFFYLSGQFVEMRKLMAYNVMTHATSFLCFFTSISKDTNCSIKCVNNKIFIMGGQSGGLEGQASAKVHIYDLDTGKWSRGPQMINDRCEFESIVVDNYLYAVGGDQRKKTKKAYWENMNCVERLAINPIPGSTLKWEDVDYMQYSRQNFGIATLNGIIYVVGGHAGDRNIIKSTEAAASSSVESLDTNEERPEWQTEPALQTPRVGPSCVATDEGVIYCLGGGTEFNEETTVRFNTVEIFNPKRKPRRWVAGPSMNKPRQFFSAFLCHNSIYVIGGNNPKDRPSVEKLNLKTNEWTTFDWTLEFVGNYWSVGFKS